MPPIDSTPSLSHGLLSIFDPTRHQIIENENRSSEKHATSSEKTLTNLIQQNQEIAQTPLSNNATRDNNGIVAVMNQSLYQPKPILSLNANDFNKLVYNEQNQRLRSLLIEDGYPLDQHNNATQTLSLVNPVIDYLTRYKDNKEKITALARLLLQPLGEYGANQGEKISSARQRIVIANWLQYAIFGMSTEAWVLKQVSDIQSREHSLFHHANLQRRLFKQLNDHHTPNKLSPKARIYYQQQIINRIMPTFMLQTDDEQQQKTLSNMMINQSEWGYLHAGLTILNEIGADINNMSLEDISNNGMLVAALLQQQLLPAEYNRYFKLPALLHDQLNSENSALATPLAKASIYDSYFDYLKQSGQNNPFIKLIALRESWQSRPDLARQQLKEHDIDEGWLNDYLYKNREVKYPNRRGDTPLLPNIDNVFKYQNQQFAELTKQIEKILLPQTFNSLSEEEQIFIQQADIQLMKVEFNAIASLQGIPLSPATRLGIRDSDGLVTRVPESIDMLKCTFNGKQRMYALTTDHGIGSYKLHRVDDNKDAILDLFYHDNHVRYDDDYKLKTSPILTLKTATDKSDMLIDKLVKRRAEKLCEKLQQEGYQETTRQKVDAFFLSLIPFYSMITEAQKGNKEKALQAGAFDLLSFFPFFGKGVQVSSRFSTALGDAVINGVRTGLKQATFQQALRESSKQFVKFGIPQITNRIPAKTYRDLGVSFLRGADPGFELLTSGGIKGINALKNAAQQLQQKVHGLTPLINALKKKAQDLPVELSCPYKVETAYRLDLRKEVQVVNIGKQRGKDIWVQINLQTNTLYGRKYLRNAAGELELAPVSIRERLYQLKTQGLGGKRANEAAKNWLSEPNASSFYQSQQQKLQALSRQLAKRRPDVNLNLSGEDFRYLNLTQVFGGYHNLAQANLQGTNLSRANLTGITMVEANLAKAIMNQTQLVNANLRAANLNEAQLTGANLAKADLCYTNLVDSAMNDAILEDAYLNNSNLTNSNLAGANLAKATISGADLTNTNLSMVNLSGATLAHTKLQGANFTNAKLTQAYLNDLTLHEAIFDQADLTGANLAKTDVSNADLSNTILKELSIMNTNFAGASLNDSFTLRLPDEWDEDVLDVVLNHFNNRSSLLTSLNSIDDRYQELKNKLALQLIHSLDQPNINLKHVTLPLLDFLAKPAFMSNKEISIFVNKLMDNLLANSSTQLINTLKKRPANINIFLNYFNHQPNLMVSAKFNSSFIQTILAARTQTGIDSLTTTMANKLYEKYLQLPEIKQQLEYEQIEGIFGDFAGKVDWSDSNAQNYLLLSPTKAGRTLVVAENNLTKMLDPDLETKWNNIFVFQHGENLSSQQFTLDECFNQDFPLFSSHFTYSQHQATFNKLLETLNLDQQLNALFVQAQKSYTLATKLIDETSQQTLKEIFAHVLDLEHGYSLKNENYNQILKLYDLTASSERNKAEHLLSLSAVFTRYSSSAVFGTELDSPLMLRYYAYALMEKAHKLDPTLITENTFNDWKDRLLGCTNTFTCTALLYNQMIDYAAEHCHDVLKKIQPSAWR
ncbi:pentapeptide repeat-containing protein [Arsenophonus sp. aPb]|uniref:pentapeptide repeat-containing protein n=1 Tax=Arsenophonus sp. aPb TaxID=3041619 RepID=UPI0024694E4E|nr:pentapeptide repeat-containing protein [Arsenophonus sp. aPb]WGL98747.1 pentapeptide repeat-containing protein [Arsenophonus sp. aPb]